MKSFLSALMAPALAAALLAAPVSTAMAGPHILVDLQSGKVLSQEDAFRRWYPASLTKLMTAYVVFRSIQQGVITLDSPVRISANAAKEPPSKMGYKPGSVLSVDNALKILMVKSANDVATATAESVAGSVEAFAARMNGEALRLGMTGSHFVNAHGLHDDNHYSTARDLALLATAIRTEFPQYAGYFSIEAIGAGKSVLDNHNTLIAHFEGADGMKTGYTCPAGWNVVASATRAGRTLIAVVIGEVTVDDRDEKAAELLQRGFGVDPFMAPRLKTMPPAGSNLAAATNMRPMICTAEARKRIAAIRKAKGQQRAVVSSPWLRELDRPRRVEAVALGGAGGPSTIEEDLTSVPLPTPRPPVNRTAQRGG